MKNLLCVLLIFCLLNGCSTTHKREPQQVVGNVGDKSVENSTANEFTAIQPELNRTIANCGTPAHASFYMALEQLYNCGVPAAITDFPTFDESMYGKKIMYALNNVHDSDGMGVNEVLNQFRGISIMQPVRYRVPNKNGIIVDVVMQNGKYEDFADSAATSDHPRYGDGSLQAFNKDIEKDAREFLKTRSTGPFIKTKDALICKKDDGPNSDFSQTQYIRKVNNKFFIIKYVMTKTQRVSYQLYWYP
jgi:hypothetical protein